MFEFAWPWLFLLLPAPLFIRWLLPPVVQQQPTALYVPFYQALAQLKPLSQQNIRHHHKLWLFAIIWILLVIAAAGPQWIGTPQTITRSGRNLMLAVDLSASMQLGDIQLNGKPVTRLAVVKNTARTFITQRYGDRLGLILFGSKAYIQTPLTYDHHTVLNMLNDATIGLAGQTTAIGDAITLAIKHLQHTPPPSRVLILLTDGANNSGIVSPLQAAKIAKEQRVKIYTIGIGADRMLIHSLFGSQLINPSADLDEPTLQHISATTGGMFFRAHDTNELHRVYHTIDQLEPVITNQEQYRPLQQYYYWPLGLALMLLWWLLAQPRVLQVLNIN